MVSIYAEFLTNIRQVSVRASLASRSDTSTGAEILDEGRRLQVRHQGEVAILELPVQVLVRPILPVPSIGSTDLAWRLPVPATESKPTRFSAEDQAVPWSSLDIKIGSPICCRKCNGCIVPHGSIKAWKDLPSENWAEMMEFWHCHKPHDEKHHQHDGADNEGLTKRGYGANSAITAQPGAGFVDLSSFMISESDCRDLLFSSKATPPSEVSFDNSELALTGLNSVKSLFVFCKTCSARIGLFNVLVSSVTLFKWQVTCETTSVSRPPSSSECLTALLTATISRSGSSKSVVVPHELASSDECETRTSPLLHLWVLNTNVVYTSTTTQGKQTAIKVLYQSIDFESAMKLIDSMTSTVQEVNFPVDAIEAVRQLLMWSNLLLPAPERTFQEWHVALLDRWV